LASEAHQLETLALREQFNTEEQQKDASTLGMWVFLITEIMFFGGMFLAYTIYRSTYPNVFGIASSSLNLPIGATNTCVLLLSSFTMVMAVRAAQLGQKRMIVFFLIITMLFGFAFLGIKASSGPRNSRSITCRRKRLFTWKALQAPISRGMRNSSSRSISP